jgi:hypothetical protein
MQRLHEDDLAGHLLRQGGWDHLDMPAIALEDEDVDLGHGKTHLRVLGDVLHSNSRLRRADKCNQPFGAVVRPPFNALL